MTWIWDFIRNTEIKIIKLMDAAELEARLLYSQAFGDFSFLNEEIDLKEVFLTTEELKQDLENNITDLDNKIIHVEETIEHTPLISSWEDAHVYLKDTRLLQEVEDYCKDRIGNNRTLTTAFEHIVYQINYNGVIPF